MSRQVGGLRRRSRRRAVSFEAMEARCLLSVQYPSQAHVTIPTHTRPLTQGRAPHRGAVHQGIAVAPSATAQDVGTQYARLAFSHESVQVGAAYVKAALKADANALGNLGNTRKVKHLGQQFDNLNKSSAVHQVGKKFEKLGKTIAGWFH